jgi:hypothetical protein
MPDAHTLTQEEIFKLRAAVISAGLTNNRAALLAHVDAEFVTSLPEAATPGAQVLTDLDKLQAAGQLMDGSLPLAVWLRNAVALASPRKEAAVFHEVLLRVQGDPVVWVPPAHPLVSLFVPRTPQNTVVLCVAIAALGGICISFFGMVAVVVVALAIMGVSGVSLRRLVIGARSGKGGMAAGGSAQTATLTSGGLALTVAAAAAFSTSAALISYATTGLVRSDTERSGQGTRSNPALTPGGGSTGTNEQPLDTSADATLSDALLDNVEAGQAGDVAHIPLEDSSKLDASSDVAQPVQTSRVETICTALHLTDAGAVPIAPPLTGAVPEAKCKNKGKPGTFDIDDLRCQCKNVKR